MKVDTLSYPHTHKRKEKKKEIKKIHNEKKNEVWTEKQYNKYKSEIEYEKKLFHKCRNIERILNDQIKGIYIFIK